ncbi:GH23010 [Drosophila grimshawi]|uniref:GH23010 n=1 Tax=Drosophila grimshawi TaxID=7222 RepID=B4JWB9_DROGR|nr:GH23010 [Drosophila grimshawi]
MLQRSWLLLMIMFLLALLLQVQMQPVAEPELPLQLEESEVSRPLYDQRQTGKYNIHVSIKDVAIIEVDHNELADESYNADDDDYYYDDGVLTIKPIKFTTTAASTTTEPTTTTQTQTIPITTAAAATVATVAAASSNMSSYSAQLLADIAATQRQRPKANNLIIMETPVGSSSTLIPKWLHARSKEEPITTTTTTAATATATRATATTASRLSTPNIEYTPAQGHDSPIFKVKVQRAAPPTKSPSRCRSQHFRDAQGKCRSIRSGSIL